jgi:hypothetical protein
LKKLFEDVGEVAQFHVLKDKKTKLSKGELVCRKGLQGNLMLCPRSCILQIC